MESIEDIRRDMAIRLTVAPKYWFRKLASNEAHQDTVRKELAEFLTHNWLGAQVKKSVSSLPTLTPPPKSSPPPADISDDDVPW